MTNISALIFKVGAKAMHVLVDMLAILDTCNVENAV
jgi:hypothetical protein